MPDDDDDVRSIERVLAGDREAIAGLVARLRPVVQTEVAHLLMRVAAARGRSARQELEDLVQGVFVALWERDGELLRRWDAARGRSLDSYIRLVARSRALDALRSRQGPWNGTSTAPSALEELPASAGGDQDRSVQARQRLLSLQAKLRARLSGRDQHLFFALFVEERTPAEVAAEVGMSTAAVYQFSSRLRRNLLSTLAGEPAEANDDRSELSAPGPEKSVKPTRPGA